MMTPVRADLPSGTVTFLFTDVEGSTKLLHEVGAEAYAETLAEHRRIIRDACAAHGGVEVDTQGDAFFLAFPTAPGAIAAAGEIIDALASGPIEVRIGLHTGTPLLTEEGYVGDDVHFGARVAASGHGGQVVLSSATAELVELELTELGEHRLKDISEAVAIYQLGDGSFPPLKTISNTNLPRPASSFVGRERETAEVVSLLRDGARLLTLSGPGGSGKTRLAIEAVAELIPEFKAGVFWVALATLRDPAIVRETIAQTLGAKDDLANHVGERELLLLLDNLEQVIDAAPELAALLDACPNLALLVTSRELLRVRGELEYAVPPLAEEEAVDLFGARSGLDRDEAISELCRRLDNLPLAVELAAARTSVLTPEQILERLSQRLDLLKGGRDAEARQQTLRATIEWSYDLLSEEERHLFARLAVFAGGCTLEAAKEVADADLDTVQSLVEKSLLRFTDGRYWMLETIREFAEERLEESGGADALHRRHAGYFLALAEEAEPNLRGSPKEWLDRLEAEHDNLRAASDRFGALGESQLALRLAGALWRFWHQRGHPAEGRRRLESALGSDLLPTAARAKALNGASRLAIEGGGDAATARLRAEEGLALHRELGDAWGTALSMALLGGAIGDEGDVERAQQLFEESVLRFRELGDRFYTLAVNRSLAWTYEELGDLDRARALHEDNLRQARATGNERVEARALGQLASLALDEGRGEDAVSMLREAYRIDRDHGDVIEIAFDLCRLARVLVLAFEGEAVTAARLLSSSEALRQEVGAAFPPWVAEMNEETLTTIRTQLDDADFAEAWEEGRTLTPDAAVAHALDSLD